MVKKIMIVDDDPDIRSTLKDLLNAVGYKATAFDDGYELFKKLENGKKPNLILLDVMMPLMSGWEIQRKLNNNPNWRNIPIIFVTGRNTDTAIKMAKKYGIYYIQKPFNISQLKRLISLALKKRRDT